MKDESKRKLIRFLNGFDRVSAKSLPAKGWNHKTVTRDLAAWEKEARDELDKLSGQDLNQELGRQLLYTLPVALFLLVVVAAGIWVVLNP